MIAHQRSLFFSFFFCSMHAALHWKFVMWCNRCQAMPQWLSATVMGKICAYIAVSHTHVKCTPFTLTA